MAPSLDSASPGPSLPPLAVIGMSLRFPDEAVSADSFWKMLMEKRCASTDFPPDRLNIDAFHHPDTTRLDTLSMRGGHFIKGDLGAFDAPFFSIGVAEAEAMDPAHRFTLETAYRAIENAGIPVERIAGTKTCVYTGCFTNDYSLALPKDLAAPAKYHSVGTSLNMMANRVSWFFDLNGPSANIDTACSSSLMALDLVCQSIWNGDSTMGLACGSNTVLGFESTASLDNLGFLSKDSRCFSFDHRANGYARGEGFGVLVIKPLQSALNDGDTIRSVIRSSSSNQDGKTPGLTQPSKDAQERLIRDTYKKAGLDLRLTRYFEAHGTGTPVGDPIEARAIGSAFRRYRSQKDPLYVGSVKSNIGHLEGASGVAGVIKVVLALERGVIPPNSNFERLNPKIDADFLNIKVPTDALPWPSKGVRRASVQSFGFGGSNSHVVMDDAYNYLLRHHMKGIHSTVAEPPALKTLLQPSANHINGEHTNATNGTSGVEIVNGNDSVHAANGTNGANGFHATNGFHAANGTHATNGFHGTNGVNGNHSVHQTNGISSDNGSEPDDRLLVWSAADDKGTARIAEAWGEYFSNLSTTSETDTAYLNDLAHTLANRRTHLPWRTFALAKDRHSIQDLAGRMAPPTKAISLPTIAFVFTGQGAQWHAMGRELLGRYPMFKSSIVEASGYLKSLGCSWDPLHELLHDKHETNVNKTEYTQPLCTALQVALVDLLESFGITPTAVVGHSSGEIAAAYSVKAISRQSAWRIAYYRGILAARLGQVDSVKGGMLSVGLSRKRVAPYLAKVSAELGKTELVVACVNSPKNVTVSGNTAHLECLKTHLDDDMIFARTLKVTVAYHSPQMQGIADEYLACIGDIANKAFVKNAPLMVSSVTGNLVTSETLSKAEYWINNMVQPVLYADALSALCSQTPCSSVKKLDGSHRHVVSVNQLIEIGPHGALQGPTREILRSIGREKDVTYTSVLSRNVSATRSILEAAGRLHCVGYPVDLTRANSQVSTKISTTPTKALVNLPEYPFNHTKSYWHESRISKGTRLRRFGRMDLLGTPSQDWNPLDARWRNIIRVSELPWVGDHKINGATLYPAVGMIAMVVEAAKQLADTTREVTGFVVKNATFQSALNIPSGPEGIEVDTHLRPTADTGSKDSGCFDFQLFTFDGEGWFENCNGSLQIVYATAHSEIDEGNEARVWSDSHRQQYRESLSKCTVNVNPESFYNHMANCGYGYGPTFRPISAVAYDGVDSIVSEVKTFQWPDSEGASAQPHVIHPTTFDGILQTVFTVYTEGGTKVMPTVIPTHIDRVWISSKGLSHPDADSVKVYANTQWTGFRETNSNINVLDAAGHEVLLELEGLQTAIVASVDASIDMNEEVVDKCHNIDWKPDLDLMSLDGLKAICDAVLPVEAEPVDFFTDVDFLLVAFMQRTLASLKGELVGKAQSSRHIQMYRAWMELQMQLLENGDSIFSSPVWRARLQDDKYIAEQTEKVASASKQGLFFTTVGSNLPKLLTGEMDALAILFQGDLAKDRYHDYYEGRDVPCLRRLGSYLDAYAHKNPGAKILEIGAGTGAMTREMMKTLTVHGDGELGAPRYGQFDYTDISPFFFNEAQETYRDHGKWMRFKTLNIELDPETQDFECGTYDLVVAASVLHATKDLTATLKNCRKLLRPGGKLLLFESTRPEIIRTSFVFGLLEGWWLSSEPYRKFTPCVDENKWDELLKKAGFAGNELVLRDYEDRICHEFSVIISTAVPRATPPKSTNADLVIIHGTEQEQLAKDLKISLEGRGNITAELATVGSALEKPSRPGTAAIFLLDLVEPVWFNMTSELFGKLRKLLTSTPKVLWVSQGRGLTDVNPEFRVTDGLFRTLNSELGDAALVLLSLESQGTLSDQQMDHVAKVWQTLLTKTDIDTEYVEHDGVLHINRLVQANDLNKTIKERQLPQQKQRARFGDSVPLRLDVESPGLLNTLQFVEDRERDSELLPDEMEVRVQSVGINFRDILIALGRLNQRSIGTECAGIVTRVGSSCKGFEVGARIATCCLDSYKTYVRLDYRSAARIPDSISFEVAAAIPVNFTTAWHSFHEIARLQTGETVLIHSGAGGTGQAAIQVAQWLGAKVFTTVGTVEKKQWLMKQYNIEADHIFSSRDTTFAASIKRITSGRGVDVVLNSLSGEGLAASWECVAPYGRFIEIGKKDIFSHSKLQMFHFARNVTFSAVDVAAMISERPLLIRKALDAVFPLVEMNYFAPSGPLQVAGVSELEDSFRKMQGGKNFGKTVIEMRPNDYVDTVLDTKPSFYFDKNATYVIAGGLGGLGRKVSQWFADRGAQNLILLSRLGATSNKSRILVEDLTRNGVRVRTPACNIGDLNSLKVKLGECLADMPPVKGCIQASMVLKDSLFSGMTFEAWETAILPKVQGSWNLNALLPKGMDFFVMFSSVSGICGSRGQANYAAGNTFMDALARSRVSMGEKATALDLGAFFSAGILSENTQLRGRFDATSVLTPMKESELFALLDYHCNPSEEHCTPLRCQSIIGVDVAPAIREQDIDRAYWLKKPMFRQVVTSDTKDRTGAASSEHVNFQSLFSTASSLKDAGKAVTDALSKKLAKTLSLSQEDLDSTKPMHSYGVDSLVAVELRNWFLKELHADVAIFDILGGATIATVGNLVASQSKYRKGEWADGG